MRVSMESAKRPMPEDEEPVLIAFEKNNPIIQDIRVDKNDFKIGRSRDSDQIIPDVVISRNHAILKCNEKDDWTITHLSTAVTLVNNTRLEEGVPKTLSHGDIIQFSAAQEYTYVFTLCPKLSQGKKRQRIDQSLLETVLTQQKSFSETQENKRKELEEMLQCKQSEQNELRTQLDKLLREQELSHGKTRDLTNEISALQACIKEGSNVENHLNQQYNQLLSTLEKERAKFEQRLNEERQKWQEALDMSKQEKETVEKSMKEQMVQWRQQQQVEWAQVMQKLVGQEKTEQQRLVIEKNQLAQKLKETEEALKEQAAITEQLQSTSNKNESHMITGLPQTAGQDCFIVELLNDGTTDQMEVVHTIDLTAEEPAPMADAEAEDLRQVSVAMDEQLTCSVCSELFIKAATLNCTHSFCQYCIRSWMKINRGCPICRGQIIAVNESLALDNFIDAMVEKLSPEIKARRDQILKERIASEKPTVKIKGKRKKQVRQ